MKPIEFTEWTGGDMPVAKGTPIIVKHRDGDTLECLAGERYAEDWSNDGDHPGDIIAYALRATNNEVGYMTMAKKGLRYHFNEVLIAAEGRTCADLHHRQRDRHDSGQLCPVEYRIAHHCHVLREYMKEHGI